MRTEQRLTALSPLSFFSSFFLSFSYYSSNFQLHTFSNQATHATYATERKVIMLFFTLLFAGKETKKFYLVNLDSGVVTDRLSTPTNRGVE